MDEIAVKYVPDDILDKVCFSRRFEQYYSTS